MAVQDFYFFGSYNAFRPFKIKVFSGADSQFIIRTFGAGYNYRAKVSGVVDVSGLTGNYTINFPLANTDYVLEIYGLFPHLYNTGTIPQIGVDKLREMIQWGDVEFSSLSTMFNRARYCIYTATDAPKFKAGASVSMYHFAKGATLMSVYFTGWNMSQVTDMTDFIQFSNQSFNIDFTHPTKGSLNATSINSALGSWGNTNGLVGVTSFKVIATNIVWGYGLYKRFYSKYVTEFELLDMNDSFQIQYMPNLKGAKIDELFNSIRDISGGATKNIELSAAQNTSGITSSIATSKGWTLIVV